LATALVPVAAGLLAGCGSNSSAAPLSVLTATSPAAIGTSAPSTTSDPAQPAMIHISSFKFKTPATVSPGSKVSVMNTDAEAHTVTADNGKTFDVKAPPGVTVTFTAPTAIGTYRFHCTYHSNMHGVLVVK
jgi:plastocyanin